VLEAVRTPPHFSVPETCFWQADERPPTKNSPTGCAAMPRLRRPGGLQPNYSTHVQVDGSLATRTIDTVCRRPSVGTKKCLDFGQQPRTGRLGWCALSLRDSALTNQDTFARTGNRGFRRHRYAPAPNGNRQVRCKRASRSFRNMRRRLFGP